MRMQGALGEGWRVAANDQAAKRWEGAIQLEQMFQPAVFSVITRTKVFFCSNMIKLCT